MGMEKLSGIRLPELDERAHLTSGSASLVTRSGAQLSEDSVIALGVMMGQVQARYWTQTLPEGAADMMLHEWETLALRFGLATFRDGLLKAVGKSRFIPDPQDVLQECLALSRTRRDADDARRFLREMNENRALCLREREEDIAAGLQKA